jgi:hypothetical protein
VLLFPENDIMLPSAFKKLMSITLGPSIRDPKKVVRIDSTWNNPFYAIVKLQNSVNATDTSMASTSILKLSDDTEGNVHRNNPFYVIVKLQKQGVAGKKCSGQPF